MCDLKFHKNPDPFSVCGKILTTNGKWFFLRKNPEKVDGFQAGTYKGINLTFGGESKHPQVFGGILIRALMNLETNEYIEGPSNSAKELLKVYGKTEFKQLNIESHKETPFHDGDAFSDQSLFYLKSYNSLTKRDRVKSPRVGIHIKPKWDYDKYREKYWLAEFRYLIHPELCKKQQTLIQIALINKGLVGSKLVTIP